MGMGNLASVEQDIVEQPKVSPQPDVEIVVHIDETLDEHRRQDSKTALAELDGINAAEFCANRFHLMLVAYDPEVTSSRIILNQVLRQGLGAQFVGPI